MSATVPIWKNGRITEYRKVGPMEKDWVGLDAISNSLIGAVISSEDTSFFGHSGIDFHELKESLKKDIKEKRWARGASTITQQVIKNVYLTQEKTLWRKIREVLWAWELDKKLSKSEVLCFYLNLVQWGPDLYGIRQAARHYFNTSPALLTPRESAFLALLLPSPEKYYVYFQKKSLTEFSKKRIEQILNIMTRMWYLTDETHESALEESLWGEGPDTIMIEPPVDEGSYWSPDIAPTEPVPNPERDPDIPFIPTDKADTPEETEESEGP